MSAAPAMTPCRHTPAASLLVLLAGVHWKGAGMAATSEAITLDQDSLGGLLSDVARGDNAAF